MTLIPRWKIRELQRELSEIKIACVNRHADVDRVVAWINDPKRKPSYTTFTEGPERQIAYAVEGLIFKLIAISAIHEMDQPKGPDRF